MLSKYNVYINDYPRLGYTLVYNLFTQKEICIKTSALDEPSQQMSEKMTNYGIIVSDPKEENSVLRYYENNTANPDELRVMLILTQKCNCRCVYCYEENQAVHLDDMIAIDDVVKCIKNKLEEKQLKRLNIIFYGGEPLIREEYITMISELLHEEMKDNYIFTIITNGVLLENIDLEYWKSLGLIGLKITIDGNKQSHDSRRVCASVDSPYEKILCNLSKIPKGIKLLINTVIDDEVFGYEEMLSDIIARGIEAEYEISVREPDLYTAAEKASLVLRYSEMLSKRGLRQNTKISFDHGIICMGKDANAFAIDGAGNILRCNGYFDSIIGKTSTGIPDKKYIDIQEECKQCKYLPICYGSCLFERRCQKEYFSRVIPDLIKHYTRISS